MFEKLQKQPNYFGATFFHGKIFALILAKKWIRLHFGPFFTNSSGHPGGRDGEEKWFYCAVKCV
jgi:hypothetical protein